MILLVGEVVFVEVHQPHVLDQVLAARVALPVHAAHEVAEGPVHRVQAVADRRVAPRHEQSVIDLWGADGVRQERAPARRGGGQRPRGACQPSTDLLWLSSIWRQRR